MTKRAFYPISWTRRTLQYGNIARLGLLKMPCFGVWIDICCATAGCLAPTRKDTSFSLPVLDMCPQEVVIGGGKSLILAQPETRNTEVRAGWGNMGLGFAL